MNNLDKIALITGATSGIGKVTALHLANEGFELILPVRNIEKGRIVKDEISVKTGNNRINLIECNLESLESVRELANEVIRGFNRLDVLINNAGVWYSKREVTVDGYEKNLAINHLSHFLLTNLLLELIKKTEGARIISVASEAHRFATINFDDLQSEKNFNSFKAYGQSKLANILFIKKLADILKDTGVTANCLHPGIVSTNLFNKMGGFMRNIFQLMMITPEKGAETSIFLATSDEIKSVTGIYFKKKRLAHSSALSNNLEVSEKLWRISKTLVGI